MGLLHLVIMKCASGHAVGGTVYVHPNRQSSIDALQQMVEQLTISGSLQCPFCKSDKMHFYDEETPFNSMRDPGAREYLDGIKQSQMAIASRSKTAASEVVCATGSKVRVTVLNMDGTTVSDQRIFDVNIEQVKSSKDLN